MAFLIKNNECKIYHPSKGLILESRMTLNRMFILLSKTSSVANKSSECCFQTDIQEIAHLWHCRYGHLSYTGLQTLASKNMVKGLPNLGEIIASRKTNVVCIGCLKGKQHREIMPRKATWRAEARLELIHADICGPISPMSHGQKRYLICFIDDFSRKAWVYFIAYKSDAFSTFKQFKSLVERESGLFIKCLRTDRGGEFISHEFTDYCRQEGIKRQLTTTYTPQQNRVAERKNRTIMNMARSLLVEKEVPKVFWPEAVSWAFHVLNRSPTSVVKEMTPEEAWSGVKPTVEHFRVFGCIAHVHIPDARRIKLDDKSTKCVLFGVSAESKGYRLYNPIKGNIIVSRDVVFEENKKWDWNTSHSEFRNDQLEWGDMDITIADQESDTVTPQDQSKHEETIEYSGDIGHSTDENEEVENAAGIEITTEDENAVATTESSAVEGQRIRRTPRWMDDYVVNSVVANSDVAASFDPQSLDEAVLNNNWKKAMDAEIQSIEKNGTWTLVELPKGAVSIRVKWVCKTKLNQHGEIDKYKARLVAKGYAQQHGIDYEEVYALVARLDTVRMILALAAQRSWVVYQLDVKSAFLQGELTEEVYVDQPKGYDV